MSNPPTQPVYELPRAGLEDHGYLTFNVRAGPLLQPEVGPR